MKRIFALVGYLLFASVALACPEIHRTKNVATKYSFPIVSVLTGTAVTSPTGLDCESRGYADGSNPGSFADVAGAEVTDATSTDANYVPLSAAETNFDLIDIRCKSSSANAVTDCATINTMVNLTQIDGNATSGNNATLNLKQLNIQNSAGAAILATSSGSNGDGAILTGNGTGSGIKAVGGATGQGGNFQSTAGNGILAQTAGGGGHGLSLVGAGSGNGLTATGGATGFGAKLVGGATSGAGLNATNTTGDVVTVTGVAGNANAVNLTGQGSGNALVVNGGATGLGLKVLSTSANAALFQAGGSGSGISLVGAGNNHGLLATGAGSGTGIKAVGGSTGPGINVTNTTGDVVTVVGVAGNANALNLAGQGSGAGVVSTGGATGAGVSAVGGATSGPGIIAASTTGDVITATASAGNGDAVQLTGQGTGFGLNSNINGNITGNLSGSAGSVTGAVGSVTTVSSGAITAASLATDTITAAKIAADAIGASELASDAVTEIAGGITASATSVISSGTAQSIPAANQIRLAASENYADHVLKYQTSIVITSGTTGKGQTQCVCENALTNDIITVCRPWVVTPTGSIGYSVLSTPNCNTDVWPTNR